MHANRVAARKVASQLGCMIGSGLCLPHIPRLGTVFGGSTELAQVVPCIGQRLEGLAAHARVADGWQIHDVYLSVLRLQENDEVAIPEHC